MREYKVAIFGARRAGKSAITVQFVENTFLSQDVQTMEDIFAKIIEVDNETSVVYILDTCGTVQFSQIKRQHINFGEGFVFVFSLDSKKSFEEIEIIRQQICKTKQSTHVPIVLVANKTDLPIREVSRDQIELYAKQHKMAFVESSAKTGAGTKDIFHTLVHEIRQQRQEKRKEVCNIL